MNARAFWISQLVAVAILALGTPLVQASELGTYVVLAASFGIGISVFHKLEAREELRKRRDDEATLS
jgi:peroxiredoxin family protein